MILPQECINCWSLYVLQPNIAFSEQRKTLNRLDAEMQYAIVLYDEAMSTDDKRLAEALWVRLFRRKDVDPILLEKAVCYVRKQVSNKLLFCFSIDRMTDFLLLLCFGDSFVVVVF